MKILSFHGSDEIKKKYVEKVNQLKELENITPHMGIRNIQLFSIGAALEKDTHSYNSYWEELGMPEWLSSTHIAIIDRLANEDARNFPLDFIKSIPVGVDLDQIKIPFLIFILESVLDKFDHKSYPGSFKVIKRVMDILKSEKYEDINDCKAGITSKELIAAAEEASVVARSIEREPSHAAWTAAYAAMVADPFDNEFCHYSRAIRNSFYTAASAGIRKNIDYDKAITDKSKEFSEKIIEFLKNCN